MALSSGVRLGPYQIELPVGVGGMGEVYRARDTRLDRTVAIKVLRTGAAAREELRQRFEREARTISSLNHPHICALYDVGQQDGTDFLVMEYLEGETLAYRLQRGPLLTEQVLGLGREIADALDKAHRQRIVHRDLKPANIMLTKAGVKLMDFGLAKLQETSPVVETLSRMTTQDGKITEEGVIVGTFQYMAPEQLEGREADPRSDIFALGAVLYEMVTGRAAFQGKTRASLIAAILSSEPPPMAQLQPLTPPALDRVVKACLAKDPDERIQTAHDVLLQLKWIAEAGSEAGVPAPVAGRRKIRERLAWTLATIFLVTTVTTIVGYFGRAPQPGRTARFEIGPPANTLLGDWIGQKVSPDGRMIAFRGWDASGRRSLWVRALDSFETRKLEGVEWPDEAGIAWAPDSRTLVLQAGGKVQRIDVTGGPSETVCSLQTEIGITVNAEEVFLANPPGNGPLLRFSANHCTADEVTKLDRSKHYTHAWPFFLPDGRHFLYAALATNKNHQIWAGSLDAPEARLLLQNASYPVYVEPGYLLFSRHGILMAQPFDWKSRRLSGEAVRLVGEQLQFGDLGGLPNFSASNTGVLVYQLQPEQRSQLYWFDHGGRQLAAVTSEPEALGYARLSPDENRLITDRFDPRTHLSDLWMYQLDRATWTRLTSTPTPGGTPGAWSPDGSRIVYGGLPASGAILNLYTVSSSGGSSEALLETGDHHKEPTDWSPDGRFVLFEANQPDTGADLWLIEVASRKVTPLAQASGDQGQGRFSPDGRWVAYVSNESGRLEVYLQAVTGGPRIQVSAGGGSLPRWRRDGREIYYTTPTAQTFKLMAAEVAQKLSPHVGAPRALFTLPRGAQYEVARDGRFLIQVPLITSEQNRLSVVVNWPAELKK